MNKVLLTGRIASELDVRYNDDEKAMLNFSVAVQRGYKNKEGKYDADFINCKAYGTQAEFIGKYFDKGNWIEIEGAILTGSYTTKDDKKVKTFDVKVEACKFVGDKKQKTDENGFESVNSGFIL